MDEFYFMRNHVPAFGSWDCNNELPFTQCFESARPESLLHYAYSGDRDLYDTPAMILVSHPTLLGKSRYDSPNKEKQVKKRDEWVMCDCECDLKSKGSSPVSHRRPAPKAVDEDLYKISPHLLRQHAKKKKAWGVFSSCLRPTCVC